MVQQRNERINKKKSKNKIHFKRMKKVRQAWVITVLDFFDFFFTLWLTSKHKTFVYHLYNAGPTSLTLVQLCINVIQICRIYCVGLYPSRIDGQKYGLLYILSVFLLLDFYPGTNLYLFVTTLTILRKFSWPNLAYMCTKVALSLIHLIFWFVLTTFFVFNSVLK